MFPCAINICVLLSVFCIVFAQAEPLMYETKVTDALRLQTWDAAIAVCDVAPMQFKLIPDSYVPINKVMKSFFYYTFFSLCNLRPNNYC